MAFQCSYEIWDQVHFMVNVPGIDNLQKSILKNLRGQTAENNLE